jgi:uncharacterized protein (TIGR02466 family)
MMKVVNHFGPPLVTMQVDESIINQINKYADQVLSKEDALKKLDYTEKLSNAVHGSFSVKLGFLTEVENFIQKTATEFFEQFGSEMKETHTPQLETMWVVSQKQGVWSYLHSHYGDIAGIIYLKIPANPAEGLSPEDTRSRYPGGISFTQGTPGPFHSATVIMKPEVGNLYLFPASLLHTVYPFFGSEERRSLSFNLSLVKKKPA